MNKKAYKKASANWEYFHPLMRGVMRVDYSFQRLSEKIRKLRIKILKKYNDLDFYNGNGR